jgi:GT2 family glycosyltransferase
MIYNGELEILEIRLHELGKIVDYFVIVEASTTFTNKKREIKDLDFDSKFNKIIPKIRHIKVYDMPLSPDPWVNEAFLRNAVHRGLYDACSDDFIILSDVDEIIKADVVQNIPCDIKKCYYGFKYDLFYFYFDYRCVSGPENQCIWSIGAQYSQIKEQDLNELRHGIRSGIIPAISVENSGWHFSYFSDHEGIINKIKNFSHQEYNNKTFLDAISIQSIVLGGEDLFQREEFKWKLVLDRPLPSCVLTNEKYHYLFFNRSFSSILALHFNSLEMLVAEKNKLLDKLDSLLVISEKNVTLVSEHKTKLAERDKQIAERDSRITHLKRLIVRMESSLIWRISWPLRFLHKKFDLIYKRWLKKIVIGIKIILIHYKSGVFDSRWYAQQIPNYKNLFKMPLLHFAFFGVYENRFPNPRFNRQSYEIMNPEWRKSSESPLLDYTLRGYNKVINKNTFNSLMGKNSIDAIQKLESLLNLIGQHNNGIYTKNYRSHLKKLVTRLNSALALKASSSSKTPKVSVIIPVYNQIYYTIICLISLFESKPNSDFEVIVADDCSTDETSTIFSKFSDRIRVIRTPGNLGFLKNCNHAAKAAKGEFVVFLNNDMVLLPEWLDSLVATISKDRECGMVGSKLLNLDGTLQEAGGIFWNDGSAWNYGRGQNPMAPEFNYKKEVDYCSGASICLRKEVWDAVGGFDEIYAPAYCEESDLAFRLRARGLKTIYQPRSVGIHLEGVSCGTDTAHGIKAYQVENLKKLHDRWSDVLKKEHFPNAEQVFLARDRSAKKRHMLFVDHYLPRPDFDAGSKQMATYLQVFVEMGFQISFWPDNLGYDTEYARPLEELGIEVISCNGGAITFEEWIKKNGRHIDVAFLSRPYVALKYIQGLKENSKASIVFYGHDIHSLRTKGELEFNPADQALLARLANEQEEETKCWEKCDVILYPSIDEKNHISEKFPRFNVDILPLYCKSDEEILTAKTITDFDKRSGILFVGGFGHSPNKDGILWFCNEILPMIRKISPDVCLTIAGSNPPEEVSRLESNFIKITGRVSDQQLSAFYENHRVAIAPLRFGGGVKGKVVESMLKGLPMVTTKVGSQGLKATDKDLAIAYSECEFADKVIELLKDEKKWLQQRYSAETFFIENFSARKIKNKLKTILQ